MATLIGVVATGLGYAGVTHERGNPMCAVWQEASGFVQVPGTLNLTLQEYPLLDIPCKGRIYLPSEPEAYVPILVVRERRSPNGPCIELLAPVALRQRFLLVDGDEVRVDV